MAGRLITVFGGSGFIGRHLVRRLARQQDRVRVAVRHPQSALFLKPMGDVGQITPVQANLRDDRSVAAAVAGADAVVNLVGILYSRGKQSFAAVHHEGAQRVAAAARAAGAKRLVQMSALGANPQSPAGYARSKAMGEQTAGAAFPGATFVRPSVVFGPEDDFFNRFALMAMFSPVLPIIGRPPNGPSFQPVYVGDVADAIVKLLDDPATAGKTYELGGPRTYTMAEIMGLVLAWTGRRRLVAWLPPALVDLQARLLELLPVPPLTRDQVKLLAADNVCYGKAPGLAELGIAPTPAEAVVPGYLARFRRASKKGQPLQPA
ncbi:MAG: complex I NDUFA9 subunit family protein [Alphaproteobacteria bacterium]|nr:complex I NDUFA9 subunit family protein [Alphaproteobacteria bacterium]